MKCEPANQWLAQKDGGPRFFLMALLSIMVEPRNVYPPQGERRNRCVVSDSIKEPSQAGWLYSLLLPEVIRLPLCS